MMTSEKEKELRISLGITATGVVIGTLGLLVAHRLAPNLLLAQVLVFEIPIVIGGFFGWVRDAGEPVYRQLRRKNRRH